MKKINKILVGLFAFSMLFSVFGVTSVVAAEDPPVEVPGDTYTYRVHADNLTMFTFRNRTQLRFNSNVNIDLTMNCEALKIGLKTFELEVDSDQDMLMNMTCTEEQSELGLLLGNIYQTRNRNRYRYQEGFCLEMKGNFSYPIQAKLKMKETNQNRDGTWAFYNGTIGEGEWVAVQTASQNGYLVAESDHFSFWTILLPEAEENTLWIYLTIGGVIIGVVAIIAVIYIKKRK
ncbi:MAG: hypothetical protein KGD65_12605 [Candidatus Lokiarchaeota archaeon]|nr:hypothetical protein [Candidatus Lokiarchaeota archaeon]